jgi:hypothetical protein
MSSKYPDVPYAVCEYTLKQIESLKGDLRNIATSIELKLQSLDQIKCGMLNNHKWKFVEFNCLTYPLACPPGVFIFKCSNCDERVMLRACDRSKWEKDFSI